MRDFIVLGVNGWKYQGHDASACLMVNGKVCLFVEEERFTRKRYAFDCLPVNAIHWCLTEQGISIDDVDVVAFGWDKPALYKLASQEYPYGTDMELLRDLIPHAFANDIMPKRLPQIQYVSHHIAHASSAYRVSGFKRASVLVLDGQGEYGSGSLGYCDGGEIDIFKSFSIEHSLGYFIEAVCTFIGLRSSDAGKLMGLAAHGQPIYDFPEIKLTADGYEVSGIKRPDVYDSLDMQAHVQRYWHGVLQERFPEFQVNQAITYNPQVGKAQHELVLSQESKDIAASAQSILESVILHVAKLLVERTGERNVVYAGGVALNCIANGRLITEGYVDGLYIQPAANDAGVSLGAALEVSFKKGFSQFERMDHSYWGPQYTNVEIESELRRLKVRYMKVDNIVNDVAARLAEGKIVAWYQGRTEVGPRALGARSILANPAIKHMHTTLNIIKSREQWRPLAPSVLEEDAHEYFEAACDSPFMLLTHYVKKERRASVPAIVHIDGTARYQSVSSDRHQRYYSLIKEFKNITGMPIIMNTSFNIGGEPIVTTPEQAIRTLYSSEIDCLAIGDFLVEK